MALGEAARNVVGRYAFHLRLRGGLAARLAYVTRYWAAYFRTRFAGGDSWQAHRRACESLAASGEARRPVSIRLPSGPRLTVDLFTADAIVRDLVELRVYDLPGCAPKPGGVVVDVGAQQGVFAALAALAVGPSGLVVAVEPEPRNHGLLRANLAAFPHAQALSCALSDKPGRAELAISPWNMGGHSITDTEPGAAKVSVEVRTLDSLKLKPDLLKIDVEGSALAVLRGGLETVKACRPAIVLETDGASDEAALKALLVPLGYEVRLRGHIAWAVSRG